MGALLLTLAAASAMLCIWIVVPPPNGVAIVATVVAIELSPYLLLVNVALFFAALRQRNRRTLAAVTLAALNSVACSLPLGAMLSAGMRPEWPVANTGRTTVIESTIPVILGDEHTAMLAYLPASGTKNPIVFTIYGGSWQRGSPEKYASLDRELAASGYAVFSLDYRHAPAYRYPTAL